MAKLILLVGPPGSGKSTMAKELETQGFVRINQDEQGKTLHLEKFEKAVTGGKDIVVDRMNFNKEQRNRYLCYFRDNSGLPNSERSYEIRVLHESYETCLTRCNNRIGHEMIKCERDARKALDFFFKNYERVSDDEADVVNRLWPEGDKPSAVICDLDGALCNIDHRLHWVRESKKNWPMFFAGIKDDSVNNWCVDLLYFLAPIYNIVLCSGRGEETRKVTESWLDQKSVGRDGLFMRLAGDFRRDDIVKEIILDFEILTRYTPYFFIDDRATVVKMRRRRGHVCLQCAKGDF